MIPSPLIHAIGWTLLHSLWQATLVALAFFLIRRFVRPPLPTYRWAVGALVITASWAAYTFVNSYDANRAVASTVADAPRATTALELLSSVSATTSSLSLSSWETDLATRINPYVQFIAMGWLLGAFLLSTRLIGGLWYLARLRRSYTYALPAWEATTATLARRLGLRRPVATLASSLAKVPMVIGHWKPVILLPVALVGSLPPEQVEAIIAHELAHVRRSDYGMNILQSVIEVIFFYHPVVWWLSSVVREEREKCCDDVAVSLSGSTAVYARALSEAEALRQSPPRLALAFAPRRGSLLARIERLVQPSASSTSPAVKLLAVATLLLVVVSLAVSDTLARRIETKEPGVKTASFPIPRTFTPVVSDTVPPTNEREAAEDEGWRSSAKAQTFDVSPRGDTIPGEPAPKGEARRRSHFSFRTDDSTRITFNFDFDRDYDSLPAFSWNDSLWLESVGELSEQMGSFSEELKGFLTDSVDTDALQEQLGAVQRELGQLQAELGSTLQRSFDEERMEAWEERVHRKMERVQERVEESQRRARERQYEAQRHQKRAKEQQQRAQKRQYEARARAREHAHSHRSFEGTVDRLESALLADELVERGQEYRFELKPKGLYVNRKKQKDELTRKYRDLLEVSDNTTFSITRTAE